jgi:hypothetical protein
MSEEIEGQGPNMKEVLLNLTDVPEQEHLEECLRDHGNDVTCLEVMPVPLVA